MQCIVANTAHPYVVAAFKAWLHGGITSEDLYNFTLIIHTPDITWISCFLTLTVGA